MTAPDHQGYSPRGETDDPDLYYFAPILRDATHPAPIRSLADAEETVRYHLTEWWDANGDLDLRVAHSCAVADLGQHVPPTGFAELAWDYCNPMRTAEARVWNARLTVYLSKFDWKES